MARIARCESLERTPVHRSSAPDGLAALADVRVDVSVALGKVRMRVGDLLALRVGDVVTLNEREDAPVRVLVNGMPIARGALIATDDGMLAVEIADGPFSDPDRR